MPFAKGDPRAREAGKRGARSKWQALPPKTPEEIEAEKERQRRNRRAYRARHPDKIKAEKKIYQERHAEELAAKARRRRALTSQQIEEAALAIVGRIVTQRRGE